MNGWIVGLVLVPIAFSALLIGWFLFQDWRDRRATSDAKIDMDILQYRAYLAEKQRPGCLEVAGHAPMLITNSHTGTHWVVCRFCADSLPRPAWTDCENCLVLNIDGDLDVLVCSEHVAGYQS